MARLAEAKWGVVKEKNCTRFFLKAARKTLFKTLPPG